MADRKRPPAIESIQYSLHFLSLFSFIVLLFYRSLCHALAALGLAEVSASTQMAAAAAAAGSFMLMDTNVGAAEKAQGFAQVS
jgi:hypothetical protein